MSFPGMVRRVVASLRMEVKGIVRGMTSSVTTRENRVDEQLIEFLL